MILRVDVPRGFGRLRLTTRGSMPRKGLGFKVVVWRKLLGLLDPCLACRKLLLRMVAE